MTYYPDLSEYSYLEGLSRIEWKALNIGWLSRDHPYPTCETTRRFRTRLHMLCQHPAPETQTRGEHYCELCPWPHDFQLINETVPGSSAEIRVRGRGAVTYAAPVLVAHYVEAHNYCPPREFVEAVLEAGSPYRRLIRRFFGRDAIR